MNQPECFTILDLVKRAILGKNVVITLHRELLGCGVVSDVRSTGNVDCDWLLIQFEGQDEPVGIDCSEEDKITIIDQ